MERFELKDQIALGKMLVNVAENYIAETGCVVSPYTVSRPEPNRIRIYFDIYRPIVKPTIIIKDDLDLIGDPLEDNCQKYYVTYEPLHAYTVIGAENIHHAYNKATKEFKGKYTKIYRNFNARNSEWEFLSVKEFGELLRKV